MLFGENAGPTNVPAFLAAAADAATAAAGGSAVITYAGVAGQAHYLTGLAFSFSAAVTAGRLTVTDGGTTVLDLDLGTAAGYATVLCGGVKKFGVGNAVVITLATGGGAGVPKLNALGHAQAPA